MNTRDPYQRDPALAMSLIVGALSLALMAEAGADEQTLTIELDTIEVTAGVPVPGDAFFQAANIGVIGQEEWRDKVRLTLGETLDTLPGVASISAGTQVGKPVIRGLSGQQIQVLSNGMGIDYQQYGERHPPTVDPFLAERLEVVRGASSLLYGSGALGGAIDVQAPAFIFGSDSSLQSTGEALISYHSVNHQWDLGLKAHAYDDTLSLQGGLIRRAGGDLNTPNVATAPGSGDPGDPRFSGRLPHTDFSQLNAQFGLGMQTDLGNLSARVTQWNDANNFLLPTGQGIGVWLRNDEAQLSGDMPLTADWRLKPTLSWQHNLRRANSPGRTRAEGYDGTVHLEFDVYQVRIEAIHGILGPFDGGTLGLEYAEKNQHSQGATVLEPGGEVSNLALFAFESKDIGPLTLQAGLRHDWHRVVGDAGKTRGEVTFHGRETHEDRVFSGSLGAVYRLSEQLALAVNAGRGFRAPSLFERYANGVHGGVAAIQQGNPDLDPEHSLNLDLGLRWHSPRLRASATLYHNQISDYIYLQDTGERRDGLPIFSFQQDDAQLSGLEVEARWDLTDRLELAGVVDLVRATNERTDEDLPLLPADSLRLSATYRFADRGVIRNPYLTLSLRHNAAKDAAPGEPFAQFDSMPFGTASTDAYTLMDLDAGIALHAFENRLIYLDLSVRNLFDTDYRDFLDTYKGYALSPGRDIRLSLNMLW